MVDGIKGSTEVKRDKKSRSMTVGRVVNMIKEELFQWSDCGGKQTDKGVNWEMQECGVGGVTGKAFQEFWKCC